MEYCDMVLIFNNRKEKLDGSDVRSRSSLVCYCV